MKALGYIYLRMRRPILSALLATLVLAAQPKPGDGSIEGHVLSLPSGLPIKKATVTLTGQPVSDYRVRLTADTDGDGKFHFANLPPGTYRLSASRAGFRGRVARRAFPVGMSDHVTDAEILLPPLAVISGRILDEDDDPSPEAMVTILKQSYSNGRKQWISANIPPSVTNENGEYRIPSLAPGRYILVVQSRRQVSDNRYDDRDQLSRASAFYARTYYPSSRDEQSALPVDVGIGADLRGIDIRLLKIFRHVSLLHRIRGRITGMAPNLDSYITISLIGTDISVDAVARPPDYAFETTVRPGQYAIRANVSQGERAGTAYGRGSITVTGDTDGVVVEMSPAPEIAGRISVAASDAPVPLNGIDVELRSTVMGTGSMSDSAGRFTLSRLYPGNYSIASIRPIPDGCYIREVTFGGQEISWDGFEVSASGQLQVVLSTGASQISGMVSGADGKAFPVSIATLVAVDGKSRPTKQAVDDDGSFKFTNVRPGIYKLFAWEEVDDDLWPDPDFRKKYEDRATSVTVAQGEKQTVQLRVIPFEDMK